MKQISILFILLNLNLFEQISNIITKISKLNRKRKLSEYKNFITDIYFSEKDENYFIKLYIGEELIPQTYILDTTFPLISSACDFCENCTKHFFPFFKIGHNTNFINCNSSKCLKTSSNECIHEKCYFKEENYLNDNKNIEGFLVNSTIFINNKNNEYYSNIPIGCSIKEGKYYQNKEINGIFGLNNNKNTFIDNLYNLNYIQNNIFTICLLKKRGYLSLGKINYNLLFNNISYINLLNSSVENNLFELKINSIRIEKHLINEQAIAYINSADNVSYFPKLVYNFIFDIFQKENKIQYFQYNQNNGYCKIINNEDEKNQLYEIFPKIFFNFEGYNFEWESSNYLIENKNKENQIVLCIGFKELIEEKNRIILGTNFMVNHDIIFDKQNQRIAFINSNCDYYEKSDNSSDKEEEKNNTMKSGSNIEEIKDKNYNDRENNEIQTKIGINNNNNKQTIFESYLNKEKEYYNASKYNNSKIYNTLYNFIGNKSTTINDANTHNSIAAINSENVLIDNVKQNNTLIYKVKNSEFKNSFNLSYSIDSVTIIDNNKSIITIDYNKSIKNTSIINYNNIKASSTKININIQSEVKSYIINKTNIFDKKNSTEDNIKKNISNSYNLITSNFKNDFKEKTTIQYQEKTIFLHKKTTAIKIKEIFNNSNFDKNTYIINKENKYNTSYESIINKDNYKGNSSNRNIFTIIKNFLANKLIYFLFAILGTILCLLFIIFISCAIISCIKLFQRRNYVEQIDIDIPTGSYSSRS